MTIRQGLNLRARAVTTTFVVLLAALAFVIGLVHQDSGHGGDAKSSPHLTSSTVPPAPRQASAVAEVAAVPLVAPAAEVQDDAQPIAREPAQVAGSRSVAKPRLVRAREAEADMAAVRSLPAAVPQAAVAIAPVVPVLTAPVGSAQGVPEPSRIAEPAVHSMQPAAVAVVQPASLVERTPAVLQDPVSSQPEMTADPLVVQGDVHPLSNQDLASVGAASGSGVTAAASPGEPLS